MHPEPLVARRILEGVATAGVGTVFGLPGVHNLAFWTDEDPDLPRIVGVRHEQTAVYAADGLARATGGLGVALTTTGPGAANAVGAFGEAAACQSPVLLVASEVPTQYAEGGNRGVLHQSRDQAGIFEPLAKAVFRPRTAVQACAAVGEAITAALSWPQGPVYVDVPTDVLVAAGPPVSWDAAERLPVDPAQLDAAAELLAGAGRVVIWAGGGVVQSEAGPALGALAQRLGAAVVTTYGARGILPSDHPCLIGLPPHEPEVADYIASADVLLAVGTSFDGMMTRNWRMPRPPRLVVVNRAEEELARNYRPDAAIHADARLALEALAGRALPRQEGVPAALSSLRAAVWRRLGAEENGRAAAFVRTIDAVVTGDTTLVLDMAIPGYWLGGYGTVERPRQLQYPVGWGTLGYALPAAVGAAVAGPVLAVCGDGGFMFAIGELATIAQERLPLTLLLVDDGGYGMLRYDQEHAGDPRRGVDLYRPDFAGLARSFGLPATVVSDVGQPLEAALKERLADGGPGVVVLETAMLPPRTTSPRWFE